MYSFKYKLIFICLLIIMLGCNKEDNNNSSKATEPMITVTKDIVLDTTMSPEVSVTVTTNETPQNWTLKQIKEKLSANYPPTITGKPELPRYTVEELLT